MIKQLLLSALLIVGAAVAWHFRADVAALWASDTAAPSSDAVPEAQGAPVIVSQVETARDDLTFSAIGTGFAQRSITLRAPAGGEITSLAILPGRKFERQDTLMRLDDTDERLALALAEARLQRATSERDRYRALQDTGAAATARFEEAETEYKVAQIAVEQARADLDDRTLRAPFDGVSGLANVEEGDRIVADDAISSYDDRSRILVEFDLPEALLSRVRIGLAIVAHTPAVEARSFDGEVVAIDSRVEADTRTARVRAAIDNAGDLLRPGASFSIRLDLPGMRYPAVPELALQFSRGALQVWRVTDGKAEQVPVQLVRRRAGLVILDGPLAEGDRVIVEGTQRLRPGIKVKVLNDPDAVRS
ncbi:efflux RND transporter periplasmic adaptor subunit [uncultured Roseovarius sp.]|uniref:efflux RND transporter periplasmic adaptor subunit n=1 Tax=uncultured Roseovarius sp. TaxID=293344 RepID=UPI00261CD762|nr:efflux RND transporter periplasmic adaptor subunit [uncultured Roseovarius sp.]